MITANSRNRRLATCSPVSLRKAGLTLGARANLARSVGYKPTAKCMIAVTKGSGSIVLGTSFLNSFYAEFNYDSNEVSLGVNSRNPWTPIVRKASDMLPNKNITVELNNTLNQWLGPIFIGEPQQYLPVQYVTSTNVTSVETNACERDCQDYEYWPANSTSAS